MLPLVILCRENNVEAGVILKAENSVPQFEVKVLFQEGAEDDR